MTNTIIDIENLNISFFTRAGEIPAVIDFSMKVMPGECMGLVGESGCGKSTVALAIMRDLPGISRVTGGTVKFMGKDMAQLSTAELQRIRGSQISMVYQEPMASLNPSMKVGDQLAEVPITHERLTREEAWDRAINMVRLVKLPDPERIMDSYPHQLSGGQQQRVVIAMALLSKPKLLLLDEPTTALDVTVEAGIVKLVKDLARDFGTAMIFVSHNLGLIRETCDRITVMYSGEAVESGSVAEVFGRMRHPYTRGLFNSIALPDTNKHVRPLMPIPGQLPLPNMRPHGCNFGPRCAYFLESSCDRGPIPMVDIEGDAGHSTRCERVHDIDWSVGPVYGSIRTVAEIGNTVLDVQGLKKHYRLGADELFGNKEPRTVKANENIDLTARQGETVAVVGESGCGKSTLAKVLLGLETATDGAVLLDGRQIQDAHVSDRDAKTLSSIQMVFQNPFDTLNPSHTIGAQIIRTLEKFGIGSSTSERSDRMLELLDLVKLPRAFAQRKPRQLSGGQKQRIGVARAFAGHPRVVIADEPMSALDVSVQAAVTELLTEIQSKSGTAMVFISHDLSIVRYLADRVIVMYLGYVVEQGSTDEVFQPPYHPYTEALLSAVPLADTRYTKRRVVLDGDIPSATSPPPGCPFQTRCPRKIGAVCESELPPLRRFGEAHTILCHLDEATLLQTEPVIVLVNS